MEPQRKYLIEKYAYKYGSKTDTLIFTGLFKISEWVHDNKIKLVKISEYFDLQNVKLEKATIQNVDHKLKL